MLRIRIWDNGGETADRYTVAVGHDGEVDYFGMSSDPRHPQGFNQYLGSKADGNAVHEGPHLGKRLPFRKWPEELKRSIWDRLAASCGRIATAAGS